MRKRLEGRRYISIIVALLLIIALCGPIVQDAGNASAAETLYRKELTIGQQNIVKRAYQMTDIQWTPLQDIAGWNSELTYRAGTTYTGLPYGQPVYASYVPWSTGLVDFLAKVNDSNSKMYTSYSSYNARAPYYSTDCSAFVSWAWGLSSRQTTSTIKNFATQISTSSFANAQVGDCLCLAGSHVVLITDITYDANGNINSIEISESTVSSVNYCCHKVRYGVGGKYTLSNLTSKYFGNGYILYRSKTRDNVTYTHSCAVPLEGDSCEACGLGGFTETPIDLTVTSADDIVLYTMPNANSIPIGTIYAGNRIYIIAYWEDISGVLWYKTVDGEWILAAKTKAWCDHSYAGNIIAAPTCNQAGTIVYTCSLCGDNYTQTLDATGHSYATEVIPPGCETEGYEAHKCLQCGYTYLDGQRPAAGHSYHNGVCLVCGKNASSLSKGDLSGDGIISRDDCVLLAEFLVNLQTLSAIQLQAADIDGDGKITSADSVLLARYVAGLIEIS